MMKRRSALQLAAMAAVSPAAVLPTAVLAQGAPIKIGAVAPKTGGLAGGAAVTQWPSIKM